MHARTHAYTHTHICTTEFTLTIENTHMDRWLNIQNYGINYSPSALHRLKEYNTFTGVLQKHPVYGQWLTVTINFVHLIRITNS